MSLENWAPRQHAQNILYHINTLKQMNKYYNEIRITK